MLSTYVVGDEVLDSLDLKVALLTRGVFVHDEVYERFEGTYRFSRNPLECSALLLPDGAVVHLAAIGPGARFHLKLDGRKRPCLFRGEQQVSEVSFPPKSDFYNQTTSRGIPFRGLAVLQGCDVLSFPYLWPCELAQSGLACKFCHCGNFTRQQVLDGTYREMPYTARDVADVVDYAVNVERCARYIQITGGSTVGGDGECDRHVEILRAIDDVAGLRSIEGEIVLFATPPADPTDIDKLFAAGADRVACDIEIWDENLASEICPGKSSVTGRERHLNALDHIAATQGRNKGCSTFVVGLEPVESFLAGADYLARRGIVPVPSIWMPHGLPVATELAPPALEFYRQMKKGLARIYSTYGCEPPGGAGFNVCLCRDTWTHRHELVSLQERRPE